MKRLKNHIILTAVAMSLSLSGCSTLKMTEDTASPPDVAPDQSVTYSTWVAVGDCAFREPAEAAVAAPLLDALLGGVITGGVNYLGNALTAAGSDETKTAAATRRISVNAHTFGPCLQIVRGWFYERPSNLLTPNKSTQSWFSDDFIGDGQNLTLWQNGLWLAAEPDFFFEGVFAPALRDKEGVASKAIALYPAIVRMNRPLFTRAFASDTERDVQVLFVVGDDATDLSREDAAGSMIDLRKLHIGETKRYLSAKVDLEYAKNRNTNAKAANYYPLSSSYPIFLTFQEEKFKEKIVAVGVAESQDGNAAAAFLGKVITGSSDGISAGLQTILIPSKRAATIETQKTAKDTALSAYNTALADAITRLQACKSDGNANNAANAQNAMINLNAASRAANKRKLFSNSSINAITLTGTNASSSAKAACATALDDINS